MSKQVSKLKIFAPLQMLLLWECLTMKQSL